MIDKELVLADDEKGVNDRILANDGKGSKFWDSRCLSAECGLLSKATMNEEYLEFFTNYSLNQIHL